MTYPLAALPRLTAQYRAAQNRRRAATRRCGYVSEVILHGRAAQEHVGRLIAVPGSGRLVSALYAEQDILNEVTRAGRDPIPGDPATRDALASVRARIAAALTPPGAPCATGHKSSTGDTASCEECGRAAWEHDGYSRVDRDRGLEVLHPWTATQRARLRREHTPT